VIVRGRVAVGGVVAAADVAALQADAQVQPLAAAGEAVLAAGDGLGQLGDQDLVEVAANSGRPLRAGEFAAATGQGTAKAKVEGVRSKLRLLAARGWLAGVPGGLFTLPDHAEETPKRGQ